MLFRSRAFGANLPSIQAVRPYLIFDSTVRDFQSHREKSLGAGPSAAARTGRSKEMGRALRASRGARRAAQGRCGSHGVLALPVAGRRRGGPEPATSRDGTAAAFRHVSPVAHRSMLASSTLGHAFDSPVDDFSNSQKFRMSEQLFCFFNYEYVVLSSGF